MKSIAFAHYSDMPLTLIGFILFMSVFAGVVWWTGLKMNKQKYEKLATGLLQDGE